MSRLFGSLVAAVALVLALGSAAEAQDMQLASPDGKVGVTVRVDEGGSPIYAVTYQGGPVIAPSPLGLELDKGGQLVRGLRMTGSARSSADRAYTMPAAAKTRTARDRYNELTVDLQEAQAPGRRMQLVFRAYDTGAAFRYRLPVQAATEAAVIRSELTRFDFPADYACWGLNLGKFGTSHEGEYDPVRASVMREHNLFDAPLVCRTDGGAAFALTEADLKNWAGMYLTGRGDGGLGAQVKLSPRLDDPTVAVRTRIGSDIVSPWRVVMVGQEPGRLIESTLITDLNPDPAFDASWVKPGKSAWDWWNGPVLDGKPVPMTTETYRRFIDFAAQTDLQYVTVDEGWYAGAGGGGVVRPGVDVTRAIPQIDLPGLVEYGRSKGVGVWIWVNWKALDAQMDGALPLYERWGVKGVKVDFLDRDDQAMVDWYHRLMARAARHKLMVNLHGAYHPTGLFRTYPNFVTQEGVMGAEYNKWSRRVTARHNVTLPYTRMLLGPMDYTPGGFRHQTPQAFEVRFTAPFVQTTRAHGLAMYVVYESPFGVVADTPDAYAGAAGVEVIQSVPTTWDETRFIAGDIGESVVVARRKGRDWFIGAMTNEQGRRVSVPLEFLDGRRYAATLWQDGATPEALRVETRTVSRGAEPLTLTLAPSGGAVVRLQAR